MVRKHHKCYNHFMKVVNKMAKISNLFSDYKYIVETAKDNIKKVYSLDDRPWIIGYSGGKDSTAVVQLVLESLLELDKEKLSKKIYVISSDTLVETPLVKFQLEKNLSKIEEFGRVNDIPVYAQLVQPSYDSTFWVNIIGRGYPSPNQSFRWCTDRLKIEPTNQFITDVVDQYGEVIMLLGVRKGESSSRDRVIDAHSVENSLLLKHTTLRSAYVFAPIMEFSIDDVWNYLLSNNSPWGGDNYQLFQLYSDSSSGECPLIVDKNIKESAGSCGNSRFGCWVCTVVNEDKALTGFINSGISWLNELLLFRNWLAEIRDDRELRMKQRTHGQIYFAKIESTEQGLIIPSKSRRKKIQIGFDGVDNEGNIWKIFDSQIEAIEFIKNNDIDLSLNGDPRIIAKSREGYGQLGLGPFTLETRKMILKRLLNVQKDLMSNYQVDYELIKKEEIAEIGKLWINQGDWKDSINEVYNDVFEEKLFINKSEVSFLDRNSIEILDRICKENKIDDKLIKKLLVIEKNGFGLNRRENIQKEIRKLLNQDYLNI